MPCIGSAAGDPEPIELPSTDPPLRAATEAATTQGGQGSRLETEPVPAARPASAGTPASWQRRAPKPHGTPSQLPPPSCIPCSGRPTQIDFFFHIVARCSCQRLSRAHREGLAALQRPCGRGAVDWPRASRTAHPGSPGRLRAPVEEGVAAPWAAVGARMRCAAAPPCLL